MGDESMKLPNGMTCGDCAHLKRCQMLFSCKPEWTHCDFYPIRFYPANFTKATGQEPN